MNGLDVQTIKNALKANKHEDCILVLNLLSTQDIDQFNDNEITEIVNALVDASINYEELQYVHETDWLGNTKVVGRRVPLFKGTAGVLMRDTVTGYVQSVYFNKPTVNLNKDKKFKKMSAHKKLKYLVRKMLYIYNNTHKDENS